MEDRRAFPRFKAKAGTYAAFKPLSYKRGQIVDVSAGGVAFQYIAVNQRSSKNLLAILIDSVGIWVDDVPCETVSDIRVDGSNPFVAVPLRRCSVKFIDLPPAKAEKVEQFIRAYTH